MPSASEVGRLLSLHAQRLRRWAALAVTPPAADDAVRRGVAAAGQDARAMTACLIDYFRQAQRARLARGDTRAHYAGWPSIYGIDNDAIEGVSRLAPLWAAQATSPDVDAAERDDLIDGLCRSLAHGCDPAHPGYWGDIGHRSTLICEAADLALALWLAREALWPRLGARSQAQVLAWLRQGVGRQTADNNWHLFVVLIDAVLAVLDPAHVFSSADRLQRVRGFARAQGCFIDGPAGHIDFYNAWCFHYLLFWLGEMGLPALDATLRDALPEFCAWYPWLFTDHGLPLFGRSLCYRFAACTPLLACALRAPAVVAPGVALAAYLANWRFFVAEGGLRAGRPTQGVFADDMRWLDPYSGPASSFWGTRSIVMFLYARRKIDWSQVTPEPLPAAREDRRLAVPALGATLHAEGGQTRIEFETSGASVPPPVLRQTASDRLRELLYVTAHRPANNLQKAGLHSVDSRLSVYR